MKCIPFCKGKVGQPRSLFHYVRVVVVEPLVYFAFLFLMKTVITKTQGLVVAIAKREYINKSNKCIII